MTSSASQTVPAKAGTPVPTASTPRPGNFHAVLALILWLVGCASAIPQLIIYGESLTAVWWLGYSRPVLTLFFLGFFLLVSVAAVIAVSVLAFLMPAVIAGWALRRRAVRLEPQWFRYVSAVFPGLAAALMLNGIIAIVPLLGMAALLVGWWVPAVTTAGILAVGIYFLLEWRARTISRKGFPLPSPEAVARLRRINPGDEPLSRMDDVGTPLLWYLTGCTPVSRDEGEVVWAYFGEVDPGVISIISHCTASYPRFVSVPDDLEQRDAVTEVARRYDLWPRFRDADFAYKPGCRTGFGVRFQGNPPLPGVPDGRVLAVGLRVFHRLCSVRYIKPDALFGQHYEITPFRGFPRVLTDGTFMEVHSRQGRPAKPPKVFGIMQFRQEGLRHASGYRKFLSLPGPEEYTGVAVDGVDGTGALLLRIGDRVHRVSPGITSPKRYDWSGYLLYRGALCEETVRCWVQGFFLLPEELVRFRLATPESPAAPTKNFLQLEKFFNFPPI